jgi:hypothetical protein
MHTEPHVRLRVRHLLLFLVSWGGVRLSPFGTSATNWPTVPAPDDRWWWMWSSRWNDNWQGKPKYSEKTCPSATLSTTNLARPDLGSNPGSRGGKPATNRLSYGTALKPPLLLYSKRFWWWCMTLEVTGFLDFVRRLVFKRSVFQTPGRGPVQGPRFTKKKLPGRGLTKVENHCSKEHWRTQRFGNWICFLPQLREWETPTMLGPLEWAKPNQWPSDVSITTPEIRPCQWEITGKYTIKIVKCRYRPETKIEKEVKIKCSNPSQQTEYMNTNVWGYFEDFHVVKTCFTYR